MRAPLRRESYNNWSNYPLFKSIRFKKDLKNSPLRNIMLSMYNDIIIKILEATGYDGDKVAFVADFMRIISSQALVALVQSLPEEKQLEADKKIAEADGQETFAKAVSEYFSDQQVAQAVDEASQKAIAEWLRSLQSTLTDEQRKNLLKLSEEMQQMAEATSKDQA